MGRWRAVAGMARRTAPQRRIMARRRRTRVRSCARHRVPARHADRLASRQAAVRHGRRHFARERMPDALSSLRQPAGPQRRRSSSSSRRARFTSCRTTSAGGGSTAFCRRRRCATRSRFARAPAKGRAAWRLPLRSRHVESRGDESVSAPARAARSRLRDAAESRADGLDAHRARGSARTASRSSRRSTRRARAAASG